VQTCALPICRQPAEPRALGEGAQMVANRLRKNLRSLKSWRARAGVDCFRAYDADLPEYAAAIDVYTQADDPDRLWLHVQEYAPPASVPEQTARRRMGDLLAAAREVVELPQERIAVKTRARGTGGSKYGRMDARGGFLVVREAAARLRVNRIAYRDTGLLLEHRPLRARIAAQARDKRFLNLFCYTGAATVQAAMGGAASTTSVDLSATYLQWLAENLRENGLGGSGHQLVQADAVDWLGAERGRYDLVFCDPPTFSNSARAGDFDVQKEHVRLLRAAVARLAPGGVLYFSNNFRRFRLDEAAVAEFARYEEISPATIPRDFARNHRIHRPWRPQPAAPGAPANSQFLLRRGASKSSRSTSPSPSTSSSSDCLRTQMCATRSRSSSTSVSRTSRSGWLATSARYQRISWPATTPRSSRLPRLGWNAES